MKIGLGAHLGSDAEISDKKLSDLRVSILLTLGLMAVICFVMTLQCMVCAKKKLCEQPQDKESYENRANSANSFDDLVRTNSKELYARNQQQSKGK
jgi:hypothetical protein